MEMGRWDDRERFSRGYKQIYRALRYMGGAYVISGLYVVGNGINGELMRMKLEKAAQTISIYGLQVAPENSFIPEIVMGSILVASGIGAIKFARKKTS